MTSKPTLQFLPLSFPSTSTTPTQPRSIHLISNLLTPTECSTLISSHTNLIPSNVTPTTVRDREVFDDEELSSLVWGRIQGFFEEGEGIEAGVLDEDGEAWKVVGLNDRWRICRYVKGTYKSIFCH